MMHETIHAIVDKGIPVTPEMIASLGGKRSFGEEFYGKQGAGNPYDQNYPARQRTRNRHLLPALILIGVGLALTGFHPWHAGIGGKIVLFIGLAFLIVWLVERKQYGNYERNITMTKEGVQMTEKRQDNDQQPPKI